MDELKSCTKCGVSQPLSEFYFRKPEQRYVPTCRTCGRTYRRNYYHRTRTKQLKKMRIYHDKNREKINQHAKEYYWENREAKLKYWADTYDELRPGIRLQRRARRWNHKLAVIRHYGGKCACCGESNPYFLEVDHINGDGSKDRKTIKNMCEWIVRNNFPDNGKRFRILCRNCNGALGFWGFCPHQGTGMQLPLL